MRWRRPETLKDSSVSWKEDPFRGRDHCLADVDIFRKFTGTNERQERRHWRKWLRKAVSELTRELAVDSNGGRNQLGVRLNGSRNSINEDRKSQEGWGTGYREVVPPYSRESIPQNEIEHARPFAPDAIGEQQKEERHTLLGVHLHDKAQKKGKTMEDVRRLELELICGSDALQCRTDKTAERGRKEVTARLLEKGMKLGSGNPFMLQAD
jgi:hypothetical protein